MSKKDKSHHKYIKLIVALILFVSLFFVFGIYLYLRDGSFTDRINQLFPHFIPVSSTKHYIESDSKSPLVSIKEGPYHTLLSRITISIISDEEIITTNPAVKLIYVGDLNNHKYYVLEIEGLNLGERVVEVVFEDKFKNKTTKSFDIARTPLDLPNLSAIPENLDWPNSQYIKDGNLLSSPANKTHKLTTDFQPIDIISLNNKGLTLNSPEIQLRADTANFLISMVQQLKVDTGKDLIIASGYRSYNNQVQTYLYWASLYGQEHADTISARPGFSEHQLGTTIDFMSPDSGYDFVNSFDQTTEGEWLTNNAYKYGFVQSYPYNKSSVTGYSYEAWHYRYIGVDAAKQWKESGLTLKEYLESL